MELVAEPVDVEEGGGEFVEEEDWGGEVDEGSLQVIERCALARVELENGDTAEKRT